MVTTRRQVLIVEDNELNLKLFTDLLESKGFDVVATQNGSEAYDLAVKFCPNLILMDIQLRGVSGYDVIKQMKADESIRHIPVIAVTAFAMKDDKEKILESGCEAYVPKPISIDPFLKLVEELLVEANVK